MAMKPRKQPRSAKRVAMAGVTTAIISSLAISNSPLPVANAAPAPTALAAALATTPGAPGLPAMPLAPGAPDPASIPDLSFGLGSRGYDALQSIGAQLETTLLNAVSLAGVLQRLGIDPTAAINSALGNALVSALTGVAIPVGSIPVLGGALSDNGITNVAALLDLIGFNLADPFNLAGAATPGLNIITAGAPFTLLKLLGIDLGWTPGFPNSVADEINGTPYLNINALTLLEALNTNKLSIANKLALDTVIDSVKTLFGPAGVDVVDLRVPVVVGFGTGAFAAGMAYPQVVSQLPFQPGGAQYTGTSPLAGSLTILPMILLRNPGRANGGLFARFYPQAGLLGIDTVTPDTAVSSSGTGGLNIPIGTTGIVLGGANLVPIKVDATVQYDPLSDAPAWPNPVSLANSAAAALFPTYLLRGITAASLVQVVDGQVKPQLAQALGNTSGPLALNLYLTVPVNDALPLLEPLKLPIDVINLFTGANLNNPLTTALEPALTSLVNLGYTDVQRTVVGGVPQYTRTLDQGNVITPFGTLPSNVDWGRVPGDLLVQLGAGIQRALSQGLVSSTPVVNPLAILANLLGLTGLPGAANAVSPLGGITGLSQNALTTTLASTVDPAGAMTGSPPQPAGGATTNVQSRRAISSTPSTAAAPTTVTTPTPGTTTPGTTTPGTTTPGTTAQKPTDPGTTAAKKAQAHLDAANKQITTGLDKLAKDSQKQLDKVAKDIADSLQKASGQKDPASKPGATGTAKPADTSTSTAGDDSAK